MARKQTTKRSAAAPKKPVTVAPGLARRLAGQAGAVAMRNPALVGGGTAFLVTFFFISANALWYQPYQHAGAFFQTRTFATNALPTMPTERRSAAANAGQVDEYESGIVDLTSPVAQVQRVLRELKLYRGPIDGEHTQDTQEAIATYQKIVGQPDTGEIDETLLNQLGIPSTTASVAPIPEPRQSAIANRPATHPAGQATADAASSATSEQITKIQTGLRAFGNEGIDVDGRMGAKTRAGIQEFQALFGLQVTGEPDAQLVAKMREIGLAN